MRQLTITPDRCAPDGSFNEGASVYVFTDRPVRLNGELILPSPVQEYAGDDGNILFNLMPNAQADEQQDFNYVVTAFDANGTRVWSVNIVMPDVDSLIWDLVPESIDMDDQANDPYLCYSSTEDDDEQPDVGAQPTIGDIHALYNRQALLLIRTGNVEFTNTEQNLLIEALQSDTTDQESRLQAVESGGDASAIESRLSAVETGNASQDTQLATFSTQVTAHATRLTSTESDITQQSSLIQALQSDTTDQESRLQAVEAGGDTSAIESRLSAVETGNASQDTQLATLDSQTTSHDTRLTNTESDVTQHDTRLSNLETADSAPANTRLDAIESDVTALETDVSDIQALNTTQDNRLDAIDQLTTTQSNELSALSTDIDDAVLVSAQQGGRLDSVETLTTSQGSRLNSIDTLNTNQNSRLDGIDTHYTNHISQTNQLAADLNAAEGALQNRVSIVGDESIAGHKTFTGDVTVTGVATLNDVIVKSSSELDVGDAIIVLNAEETSEPSVDAGFEIERGTQPNVQLLWIEGIDKFAVGLVGSTPVALVLDNDARLANIMDSVTDQSIAGHKTFTDPLTTDNELYVNDSINSTSAYVLFAKPARSPAIEGTDDLDYATRAYVDGPRTSNLVIENDTSRVLMQNSNGELEGHLFSNYSGTVLANHDGPTVGAQLILTMYGTYFNKAVHGIDLEVADTFTTRGYVDQSLVSLTKDQTVAGDKTFSGSTKTQALIVNDAITSDNAVVEFEKRPRATAAIADPINALDYATKGYTDDTFFENTGGVIEGDVRIQNAAGVLRLHGQTDWSSFVMDIDDGASSNALQFAMRRAGVNQFRIVTYNLETQVRFEGPSGTTQLIFRDGYISAPELRGVDSTDTASLTTKGYVDGKYYSKAYIDALEARIAALESA